MVVNTGRCLRALDTMLQARSATIISLFLLLNHVIAALVDHYRPWQLRGFRIPLLLGCEFLELVPASYRLEALGQLIAMIHHILDAG